MNKITAISLFSGIGAFDYAVTAAGFDIVAQVEIEPYCRASLQHNSWLWPNSFQLEDVKDSGKHNLPYADLLFGGVPCQPASDAGSKRGTDDERWLWPDALRIVEEIKPKGILFENVPGLRTLNDGREFREIVGRLTRAGYSVEWRTLAAHEMGATHPRKRLWIMAYASGIRRPGSETLSERALHNIWDMAAHHNEGQTELYEIVSGRKAVGDVSSQRLQGNRATRQQEPLSRVSEGAYLTADSRSGASGRSAESRVVRDAHGIAAELVTHQFPAGQGPEQWDYEPSRQIAERCINWESRIKALGNAVVPQCAFPFALAMYLAMYEALQDSCR